MTPRRTSVDTNFLSLAMLKRRQMQLSADLGYDADTGIGEIEVFSHSSFCCLSLLRAAPNHTFDQSWSGNNHHARETSL